MANRFCTKEEVDDLFQGFVDLAEQCAEEHRRKAISKGRDGQKAYDKAINGFFGAIVQLNNKPMPM